MTNACNPSTQKPNAGPESMTTRLESKTLCLTHTYLKIKCSRLIWSKVSAEIILNGKWTSFPERSQATQYKPITRNKTNPPPFPSDRANCMNPWMPEHWGRGQAKHYVRTHASILYKEILRVYDIFTKNHTPGHQLIEATFLRQQSVV